VILICLFKIVGIADFDLSIVKLDHAFAWLSVVNNFDKDLEVRWNYIR